MIPDVTLGMILRVDFFKCDDGLRCNILLSLLFVAQLSPHYLGNPMLPNPTIVGERYLFYEPMCILSMIFGHVFV